MVKITGDKNGSIHRRFFLLAGCKEEARLQAQLMLTTLQALGFSINTEKSLLNPCQEIELLGVMIQSHPPVLHLPLHKLETIKSRASQLLCKVISKQNITVRDIAQFIGTANAVAVAIPLAPLFIDPSKPQKISFKLRRRLNNIAHLSSTDREKLSWWMEQTKLWNLHSLLPPVNWVKITIDASNWGWGAVYKEMTTGGSWPQTEALYLINYLEMLAAILALQCFTKITPHPLTVYLYMDNTTAISYLNHKRRDNFPLPLHARETNLAVVHVPEHLSSCQSPIYLDISIQWQTESPVYYWTDGTDNPIPKSFLKSSKYGDH